MRPKLLRACLPVFLALLSGCASAPGEPAALGRWSQEGNSLDDVTNGLMDNASRGFTRAETDVAPVGEQDPAGAPAVQRMLVHHGAVTVAVPRAEDAVATFLASIARRGGYLSRQEGTTVTARLPAEHFDAAFAELEQMGRVLDSRREASDVTEEYLDMGIRLENARRARDRLLELLAKAEKVEDMLAIEKELTRLTAEIESMEGRLKFLADQVAMATLTGAFRSESEGPAPPRRRHSRFAWIRAIGADRVLEGF